MQALGNNTVAITVVATMGNMEELKVEILRRLARVYGGATATVQQGAYVMEDGNLVVEDGYRIHAFTGYATEQEATVTIMQIAKYLFDTVLSAQESVLVEVFGEAYLVDEFDASLV